MPQQAQDKFDRYRRQQQRRLPEDESATNLRWLSAEPLDQPQPQYRRINEFWLREPIKPANPPKGKSNRRTPKGIPSAAIVPTGEIKIQES